MPSSPKADWKLYLISTENDTASCWFVLQTLDSLSTLLTASRSLLAPSRFRVLVLAFAVVDKFSIINIFRMTETAVVNAFRVMHLRSYYNYFHYMRSHRKTNCVRFYLPQPVWSDSTVDQWVLAFNAVEKLHAKMLSTWMNKFSLSESNELLPNAGLVFSVSCMQLGKYEWKLSCTYKSFICNRFSANTRHFDAINVIRNCSIQTYAIKLWPSYITTSLHYSKCLHKGQEFESANIPLACLWYIKVKYSLNIYLNNLMCITAHTDLQDVLM